MKKKISSINNCYIKNFFLTNFQIQVSPSSHSSIYSISVTFIGQNQNQTLNILLYTFKSRNNYTFLITNPKDLGLVSSATVKSTQFWSSIPLISRIGVNFMSNIVKRFDKKIYSKSKTLLSRREL